MAITHDMGYSDSPGRFTSRCFRSQPFLSPGEALHDYLAFVSHILPILSLQVLPPSRPPSAPYPFHLIAHPNLQLHWHRKLFTRDSVRFPQTIIPCIPPGSKLSFPEEPRSPLALHQEHILAAPRCFPQLFIFKIVGDPLAHTKSQGGRAGSENFERSQVDV